MAQLRILYGYPWFASDAYGNVRDLVLEHVGRLRAAGFDIEPFCLTLAPPGPPLGWVDLELRWRQRDRELLTLYEQLEAALDGRDVLINASGINLHPDFVAKLPVFTVFQCFDDPESSRNVSRPVVGGYDLCLVGNIAEVESYRRWGARHAEWTPMGLQPTIYDSSLTEEAIMNGERDIDLFMMIDRSAPWRRNRMERLAQAFPDGHFYGRGWSRGYLPAGSEVAYLRRAKIGPNVHNSTGPINYRTFYLPANGVLQICDNKSHLGQIFALGREVIGFDRIDECIDLCRYYLAHDQERRRIAAAGWKRAVTEYTEEAVFARSMQLVERYYHQKRPPKLAATASPPSLRDRIAQRFPRAYDSLQRVSWEKDSLVERFKQRKRRFD